MPSRRISSKLKKAAAKTNRKLDRLTGPKASRGGAHYRRDTDRMVARKRKRRKARGK